MRGTMEAVQAMRLSSLRRLDVVVEAEPILGVVLSLDAPQAFQSPGFHRGSNLVSGMSPDISLA